METGTQTKRKHKHLNNSEWRIEKKWEENFGDEKKIILWRRKRKKKNKKKTKKKSN